MKPLGYTKLYNYIVDHYLTQLSGAEFKILIVIIRSTIGWNKKKDRITRGQFCDRTHLSKRAVSMAIASLEAKGLIGITNEYGSSLSAKDRQYNAHIYYQLAEYADAKTAHPLAKNVPLGGQLLPITIYSKRQQKKGESFTEKQKDSDRIAEILGIDDVFS